MANKYLDENGLLYFWGKVKTYVASVLPTKTSELTNDSGFITSADVPAGVQPSTTTPKMNGTAATGTESAFARGDHVHPTDTSRAPLASPTFTGTPAAPTAAKATNTTQIATTAFVKTVVGDYAAKSSPTLTGTPKAPTASAGDNSTQIATTAFVSTAVANAIAGVTGISYSVVQSLPQTGQNGVIYLVAHNHGTRDAYDEYIWTGSAFEKLGNTDIDLTDYMLKTDMVAITNAEIDTIMAA